MPRGRKKEQSELQKALEFVAKAQAKEGTLFATHCRINDNYAIAYNGILAAGCFIGEETPNCCPHTFNFIHALDKAKGSIAVTVEDQQLTVKTNKFRAIVPTISDRDLVAIFPDAAEYSLTDAFRDAATKAALFTREGAQTVVAASVMLRNGSLVGTNGQVIVEAWHGSPTPPGIIVPKSFIDALSKVDRKITNFGYSEISFTIWFEDNSWIKTQLYKEPWPNIDSVLSETESANPGDLPKEFWEAIKTVAPFAESQIVFTESSVRSLRGDAFGASYNLKGLPDGLKLNHKHLLQLEDIATTWDFETNERMAIFFGEKIRGAIMKGLT